MSNFQEYKDRDLFTVVDNVNEHGFAIGETLRLIDKDSDPRFEHLDSSDFWWCGPEEVVFKESGEV